MQQQQKKNAYKQNDCNVESCVNRCNLYCEFCSIWFYTFNVRLYICFVSLLSLNLYITSCVFEFITPVFCTSNVLVNVNLFFSYFEKGFLQKHEHHRTKSSLLNTVYSASFCGGSVKKQKAHFVV